MSNKPILITQHSGQSIFRNEILALELSAKELGWDIFAAEGSWRVPEDIIAQKRMGVPYGSQLFCETIAQQMDWKLLQNPFDWLTKVHPERLRREVRFMNLEQAIKVNRESKEPLFIKPADDKVFPAKVYSQGALNPVESVPRATPTLISEVVSFDLEYRCFINRSGSCSTWSNYIFFEHLVDPRFWEMVPFGNKNKPHLIAEDAWWDVEEESRVACVIDVGRIPGKGWAIIESNPVYCSGLYGCDPMFALEVMAQACKRVNEN